ncbi:GNAT family N-acetyltransferase [Deferrisoma sp.]
MPQDLPPAGPGRGLRALGPADPGPLLEIVRATGVFRPEEVEVAAEVLSAAAERGEASGYRCRVAEGPEGPVGFACYGPTPCTRGTYDLYWIAVAPRAQGRGVARRLLEAVIAEARAEGGRLLVAETSGTPAYGPAHRLYEACGFRLAARIDDFYLPGDAKLVFVRSLGVPPSP